PEPTSYREDAAGNVLIVDLAPAASGDAPDVEVVAVGGWRFVEVARQVDGAPDLDALLTELDTLPDRRRTIVKVKVDGTLSLTEAARLERELEAREPHFGALEHPERHLDITIAPTDEDLDTLATRGHAAVATQRLRARAAAGGDDGRVATDAL